MTHSPRLDAALEAAAAAAELIRDSYRRDLDVRTKADGSPVTDADVAAEQAIRRIVQEKFPEDGFYGEETAALRLDADHLWIVDPIDGTKSFVRHYPMFSTQIAVMRRGKLETGVSSAPAYGETAWAERGKGAWMAAERIEVSLIRSL
jgi:histidinol-phosphatase